MWGTQSLNAAVSPLLKNDSVTSIDNRNGVESFDCAQIVSPPFHLLNSQITSKSTLDACGQLKGFRHYSISNYISLGGHKLRRRNNIMYDCTGTKTTPIYIRPDKHPALRYVLGR